MRGERGEAARAYFLGGLQIVGLPSRGALSYMSANAVLVHLVVSVR
jgi:hypothetical protein